MTIVWERFEKLANNPASRPASANGATAGAVRTFGFPVPDRAGGLSDASCNRAGGGYSRSTVEWNFTLLWGGTLTGAPVRGLRPRRAERC